MEIVTKKHLMLFSGTSHPELSKEIAAAKTRSFSDAWSATGQKSWVNLAEVVGFSLRQAK